MTFCTFAVKIGGNYIVVRERQSKESIRDTLSHFELLKFKKKNRISFELLSDDKKKVQKLYGVWGLKTFLGKKFMGTIRSTFFIKNGIVIKIWTNVRVKDHAKEVLKFV